MGNVYYDMKVVDVECKNLMSGTMKTIKIIIAGGREFDNYQPLCDKLDNLTRNYDTVEIVCGEARGADLLGRKYGESRGLKVHSFPADWDEYGKSAGYRRNAEMADFADALVAFWDHKSKGTKHMIDLSEKKGIMVRVVKY